MEDMYLYFTILAFIVGAILGWQLNKQRMNELQENIIDLAMNIEDFIGEVRILKTAYKAEKNKSKCKCDEE